VAHTTTVLSCSGSKSDLTDNTHLHPPESVPPTPVYRVKEWHDEWWKVDANPTAISHDDDMELESIDEGSFIDAYLITMSMDASGRCVLPDFDIGTWGEVGGAYPYLKSTSHETMMAD
jgi:hypothetical protein